MHDCKAHVVLVVNSSADAIAHYRVKGELKSSSEYVVLISLVRA